MFTYKNFISKVNFTLFLQQIIVEKLLFLIWIHDLIIFLSTHDNQ